MAKCEFCDKGVTFGIQVSHSHRRSNRTWKPNIQRVRAIVAAWPRIARLVPPQDGGPEVILARNGRPVARLVPWTTSAPIRSPGAWSGRFEIPDDVVGSDPDVIEMFDRSADSAL